MATSASAQISDSWTSPPLEKMPTTVQSLSRNAMREPTLQPLELLGRPPAHDDFADARREAAAFHQRQLVANGEGGRLHARGTARCWDRSARGAADPPSPPARRRPAAGPSASRAMAGRLASSAVWSRATPLDISASEPARSMITRSSRPVLASVWRNPSAIESTDTSTPATPAMPMMTTREVPRRWGRLRRLTRVICAIWSQRAHHRCPASASTMRSRRARQAGGRPTASASATATATAADPGAGLHEERREAAAGGAVQEREHARRRRPCPPRRR